MTRIVRSFALVSLCWLVATPLRAQDTLATLITRTIPLHHLRAPDAARLVAPYIRAARGGVYEAGAVQAVTVTESAATLARIDSVIRENDRSPAVLVFRFQLIAADDTPARDSALDSIEPVLRGLFRFKGYRLIGEGSTTAGEFENFSLTVAGGEDRFALGGEVIAVQAGPGGSVRLRVRLARAAGFTYQGKPGEAETLLTTGLTVPLGQTVVLGSAAPGGKNQALILAVRPEMAIAPRR